MNPVGAILAALFVAGCASPPWPPPPSADVRFVVLGPEGAVVARVITADTRCPDVEVDGARRPMTVRMPAATMPLRPSRGDLPTPKPSAFPVLTCELTLPLNVASASIGGQPLPLPKANPRRIVLIGDTGCAVNPSRDVYQACDDPDAWPFERAANAAAATAPDLVIHVGDYHYREGPCAPDHPGCAGSPWGYGWDVWNADLFRPARNLLKAAPWIVVRGNHESCNRAGQGWWRFLDPRPLETRQDCNLAADDDTGNFSEPYAVPLGRPADTQLLVFDSSWVGVKPLAPTEVMYRNYRAQFERIFALAVRSPHAFFLNHHPVLGFAANPGKPESPFPGNAGLQSVLEPINPGVLFPSNVDASLAGHNHTLEIVTFATPHPPQFIIGNGGTRADAPLPMPFPKGAQPAPGAVVAELVTTTRFGFMTMEREGAGWSMRAWDANGAPLTSCTLSERKAACTPIPD